LKQNDHGFAVAHGVGKYRHHARGHLREIDIGIGDFDEIGTTMSAIPVIRMI